jgi:hypothetical protein
MTTVAVVKFQLRRDTAINWSASIIKLEEGEPGFDTTNNILKIGPKGGALWRDIPILANTNGLSGPIRVVNDIPDGFAPLYWNSSTGEIVQLKQ